MVPAGRPASSAKVRRGQRGKRRGFGGFDHHGAARCQGPGRTCGVIIASGKFHGVIAATTPTGSRSNQQALSAPWLAGFPRAMRLASSAKNSIKGGAVGDFPFWLPPAAALLQRHQAGQVVGVRIDQIKPSDAAVPRAAWNRRGTPGGASFIGRCHGIAGIVGAHIGHPGQCFRR